MAKTETYTINDQPTDKDSLDFVPYVETLTDIIKTGNTPLTIGIFGTWGSGKTSLMKMVRKQIPKKFTVIWFEAWKFDREETLWRVLLSRVLREICKAIPKDKTEDIQEIEDLETFLYTPVDREKVGGLTIEWGKMGEGIAESTLQIGLSFLPGGSTLSDLLKEFRNKDKSEQAVSKLLSSIHRESAKVHIDQIRFLEQFHERFTNLVAKYFSKKNRRLVVFVDDLDRCLPEKAIEVLEAIKLFLDANNCVFLIGLDQEVIARGIEVKYKEINKNSIESQSRIAFEGIRYLEKIIQLPFQIPPVEKSDMGKFVQGLAQNWPDNQCPRVFAEGLADNPRQIKRTVNVFFLLWKLADKRKSKLKGEIKPVRLAKIVTIQSIYPDLYNMLKSNPDYLGVLEKYYLYFSRKESSQIEENTNLEQQLDLEPPKLPSCVIRSMSTTPSGPCRPPNPEYADHCVRSMSSTF